MTALVAFLTDALEARGADARIAQLRAQVGMDVCVIATRRWMYHPSVGLDVELERAFDELHEVPDTLSAKR